MAAVGTAKDGARQTEHAAAPDAGYGRALALLATLFFMWGFITVINNTLLPHLRSVFDLNYTQNFKLTERINFQIVGDLFNVFDKQTGYNIQQAFHASDFGEPRTYFEPLRFQIAARLQF